MTTQSMIRLRKFFAIPAIGCVFFGGDLSAIAGESAFGSWILPGGVPAARVGPDGFTEELVYPLPTGRQAEVAGEWHGVVSLDLYGAAGAAGGRVEAGLVDPVTGEVLVAAAAETVGRAPHADWAVIASSQQDNSATEAFDGDPGTQWHSRYGDQQPGPPHWIGLRFGRPVKFSGIRYLPRQEGFSNGVARRYRLEVLEDDTWRSVAEGETDRKRVAEQREVHEIVLASPLDVDGFRLVIESDWSGGGFGTAAEIDVLGWKRQPQQKPVAPSGRLWLPVSSAQMGRFHEVGLGLRVRSGGEPVVVSTPRIARFHPAPDARLIGKANGVLGPDKLGAGLLGFDGLLEHGVDASSVLSVRPEGPAAKAGLRQGDVILAVDGTPLAPNDLAPGWGWFGHSHEAMLGRAGEQALAAKRPLVLKVLRAGEIKDLPVELPQRPAFTNLDPQSDAAARAMLDDMLGWLCRNQREDGSWSGDIIRTTFSSLALLATGDAAYDERVRKAVDWSMRRYPEPETYGNLGFWSGAYAGILYSEWHLRTGDERVLPYLEALRDWAHAGRHQSVWQVPALGHGPPHLPYGNKSLVAPSCHLLVFEALAVRCGMKSSLWELLMPYMEMAWSDPRKGGNGTLGYNRSYKDPHEFWSRSGLFAMASHLRGERPEMERSMIRFMEEHHPWFRNSHAYGEPGGAWGLLALQLSSPSGFQNIMKEYAWWFSLAWEPGYGLHFTTPHMGAPYMGEDDLINAAYALVLQSPKKNLHLTGRSK